MEACALALQSEDLSKKEREGERRNDLNDTNIAWPARASGPCGRKKKVAAYFFFTTLGFPAGVFPTF